MESIEFIAILATFSAVLFWYIQNVQTASEGDKGLFAITQDPETTKPAGTRPRYTIKPRLAHSKRDLRDAGGIQNLAAATPAFNTFATKEGLRRKFQRQDEARYRVKDKAAAYKPRSGPNAA